MALKPPMKQRLNAPKNQGSERPQGAVQHKQPAIVLEVARPKSKNPALFSHVLQWQARCGAQQHRHHHHLRAHTPGHPTHLHQQIGGCGQQRNQAVSPCDHGRVHAYLAHSTNTNTNAPTIQLTPSRSANNTGSWRNCLRWAQRHTRATQYSSSGAAQTITAGWLYSATVAGSRLYKASTSTANMPAATPRVHTIEASSAE